MKKGEDLTKSIFTDVNEFVQKFTEEAERKKVECKEELTFPFYGFDYHKKWDSAQGVVEKRKSEPAYAYEYNPEWKSIAFYSRNEYGNTTEYVPLTKGEQAEFEKALKAAAKKFPDDPVTAQIYAVEKEAKNRIGRIVEKRNELCNPQKTPFDILINEKKNGIELLDGRYETVKWYDGMKYDAAAETRIKNNFPGKKFAFMTPNVMVSPYFTSTGAARAPEKLNYDSTYTEKVTDYVMKTILEGSSVLFKERKGADYSVRAETGKPFTGIQQLYFQQIREDNKFESPYFTANNNYVDLRKGKTGFIMGVYDKGTNSVIYDFYYNFDQMYKTEKITQWPVSEHMSLREEKQKKEYNQEEKQSPEQLQKILQNALAKYLYSSYTGSEYRPSKELRIERENIAEAIRTNKVSVFETCEKAVKMIQGGKKEEKEKEREAGRKTGR